MIKGWCIVLSIVSTCYVMAGTFTRRESGDWSARTKQEDKDSKCKLQRVTWQLLMTSGYPKSKTKENLERCYVTAGTFTWRESGDWSARTKQEDKGSECKLRRVTWQLLMMSGYPKSKTKENLERTGLRGRGKGRFNGLNSLCRIGTKKSSLRLQAT